MSNETMSWKEVDEKFRPFVLRCSEVCDRAHAAGIPDTKFVPIEGDTHRFHRRDGLIKISPFENYPLAHRRTAGDGALNKTLQSVAQFMKARAAGDPCWARTIHFPIDALKLWIRDLEGRIPDEDLAFLGRMLGRMIIAVVEDGAKS